MAMDGFIQTDEVTRVHSSGVAEVEALRGVTLSLSKGPFVGITGASGSGKSTLMNLLGGLDTPSSGGIYPTRRAARVDPVVALRHD